jgi:hypothetical protein
LFRLVLESHDGRAPGADSEEKHEPVSDIDTVAVDSLKALDPKRPIREADICGQAVSAEPGANDPSETWAAQGFAAHIAAGPPISLGVFSCFDGLN